MPGSNSNETEQSSARQLFAVLHCYKQYDKIAKMPDQGGSTSEAEHSICQVVLGSH